MILSVPMVGAVIVTTGHVTIDWSVSTPAAARARSRWW